MAFLFFGGGCSTGPEGSATSGSLWFQGVAPDENGVYGLRVFQLDGIKNLENLEGKYASFIVAPKRNENHLEGMSAKAHFIKSRKGYLVPSDDFSAQILSLYRSFQILYKFDQLLGIENLNQWPRKVAVAVSVAGAKGANNALYEPNLDSFVFVRYTEKQIPIAVNFGIVAHEHFHSLFQHLVLQDSSLQNLNFEDAEKTYQQNLQQKSSGSPASPDRPIKANYGVKLTGSNTRFKDILFYNLTLLKGLNEGLADAWAYLVLGDPDFIKHSMPLYLEARTLRASQEDVFVQKESIQSEVQKQRTTSESTQISERSLISYSYAIGTQYSRMIRNLTLALAKAKDISEGEARKIVAAKVIASLPSLKNSLMDLVFKTEIDPTIYVQILAKQFDQLSQNECEALRPAIHDQFSIEKCMEQK